MRLPIEWITEYVPIEADAEEIAHRLTMAGLEVEETEESALGPVLNIKVTPNRGDCLSVVGVARELAAAYKVEMKAEGVQAFGRSGVQESSARTPIETSVTIESPDLCPRYAAQIVRNLKVGPSPDWMQARLIAAGMRPINNIVDVTNYVMLEMGQPLHAFDYDTLQDRRIVVRRAHAGETLRTLDDVERALTPEMLVIADAERPVAMAGVMGGADTEMSEKTRTLLLESAHFHPLSVRSTARALNLRTEASYRFERFVDPAGVVAAADRACALIAEHGMGEVVPGVVDVHPQPAPVRAIAVRPQRVSMLLGFEVETDAIVDSLTRLGFRLDPPIENRKSKIENVFTIPSWRPDIVREVDIVEEVGRVVGYEHIPEKLPVGVTTQGSDSDWGRFAERVRGILTGAGLQEIVSHSLIPPGPLEDPRDADHRIAIRSALSAELSGLRRSLMPGLTAVLDHNARRGQSPLALFEIGHVFHQGTEGYKETTAIGGALAGSVAPLSWQREGRTPPADFYIGRGIIERLADSLGIEELGFVDSNDPRLHPGRAANVTLGSEVIGYVGELHPDLTDDLHVRERVIVFELAFEAVQAAAHTGRRFAPLSPYPAVVRDLAPRLAADVPYERVREAVTRAGVSILERVALTDVYTGLPLPEGTKSLTLSFTFRSAKGTLTDAEVNDALVRLRAALESDCGATFVG